MRKISIALLSVMGVVGIGILVPNLIHKDTPSISAEEAVELKKEANIFENPLDFLQITKLVVREKKDDIAFVDAYTYFGFKYAVVEVKFGSSTSSTRKQPTNIEIQCPSGMRFGINPICH